MPGQGLTDISGGREEEGGFKRDGKRRGEENAGYLPKRESAEVVKCER